MKYRGRTVSEALETGLKELGKTEAEVTYEIVQEPKKGFLGLGKQDAIITLKVIKQAPLLEVLIPEKDIKSIKSTSETTVEDQMAKQAKRQAEIDQAAKDLGEYLANITKKIGIAATIQVMPEKHVIYYDFETDFEGQLIGKRGRILNALQILAQDFLDKQLTRRVSVVLNVSNYREKRAETLKRLAQKVANDAITQDEVQYLDPMPAFERKIVHAALARDPKVKTSSRGKEPYRSIVIAPNPQA